MISNIREGPASERVAIDGVQFGQTPLGLVVPTGEHMVSSGKTSLCLRFTPESEARVLVRAGEVVSVEGAERCTSTVELLEARPMPSPANSPPALLNRAEVQRALVRAYPSDLRKSGQGGSPEVSLLVDGEGRVVRDGAG